jgi:hypothetical protein
MINDENEMVDLYIPRKWCVPPATVPAQLALACAHTWLRSQVLAGT